MLTTEQKQGKKKLILDQRNENKATKVVYYHYLYY